MSRKISGHTYLGRMQGELLVLRSSAGSGKTYALVRHYLRLCLSRSNPGYYRHILALTFTNAARAEMRNRVLMRLQEFSSPGHIPESSLKLFQDLCGTCGISGDEMHRRCSEVLYHMVHHYDQIGITTIDSFTHRLVRSFSRELNLDRDFRVELDSDAFLLEVTEKLLERAGKDEELTDYLTEFALEQLGEGSDWRIGARLHAFARILTKEQSEPHLAKLGVAAMDSIRKASARLRDERRMFLEGLEIPSRRVLHLFSVAGIGVDDLSFKKSGAIGPLLKWIRGEMPDGIARFRAVAEGSAGWFPKNAPGTILNAFEEVAGEIGSLMRQLNEHYTLGVIRHNRINRIYRTLHLLGLTDALNRAANQLREEQNVLLIQDFQRLIGGIVQDSPAPFIYEKIGERYHHILFDEFQDTSTRQWVNAIPLIENSLAGGYFNLIVGDGKQAIYRWRNGNAEQFVQLPKLPEEARLPYRDQVFEKSYRAEELRTNRRSASAIIEFNNLLYTHLSEQLGTHRDVYAGGSQDPFRQEPGYVCVSSVFAGDGAREESRLQMCVAVEARIRECLADGYSPSDIAILTRKGYQEGQLVADYLVRKGFEIITRETYLLAHSARVRWIMHLLGWLSDPGNDFHRVSLMTEARAAFPEHPLPDAEVFLANGDHRNPRGPAAYLEACFPGLNSLLLSTSDLFSTIQAVITHTGIPIDTYLEFLLDLLSQKVLKDRHSLRDIVLWWDESRSKLYIESSDHPDAIEVLTVHKSKGLEYPVVIYPRFSGRNHADTVWVDPGDILESVPSALVSLQAEEESPELFPEEIEEIALRHLDEVNVCYVATTRAEERLYIIQEGPSGNSSGSWLDKRLISHFKFQEQPEHTFGSKTAPAKSHRGDRTVLHVLQPKGAPAAPHALRKSDRTTEEDGPRVTGERLHACLSLMQMPEDLESAWKLVCQRERIQDTPAADGLLHALNALVDSPEFRDVFAQGVIWTEREILLPDGSVVRPDRIIIREDEWLVIDFKTGNPRPTHREQVAGYMRALAGVHPGRIRGMLAYLSPGRLEEVHSTP